MDIVELSIINHLSIGFGLGFERKLFNSTVRWFTPPKKFYAHPKTRSKPAPVLITKKFLTPNENLNYIIINRFHYGSYRQALVVFGF